MKSAFSKGDHRHALQEQTRVARAAQERFILLSEAVSVLAAEDNPLSALAAMARMTVSALADWCFIDLVDEAIPSSSIRRLFVGSNLNSLEKKNLAEDVRYRHYPISWDAPHGTPMALRTGRPELLPVVEDSILRAIANDKEHLRTIRRMNPASYMCVPFQWRRRLIGAMGFVSTKQGRQYDKEDLLLAEGLGRIAALAVGNSLRTTTPAQEREELKRLGKQKGSIVSSPNEAPDLTRRQHEILLLIHGGMASAQIATELSISESTVRGHIRHILRAFDAHSQIEAVSKARTLNLLPR